jgi:NTE family protein
MDSHDQISVIEALSCLGDMPLNHLSELIKRLDSKRVPALQAIFKQGDQADEVYFIGSGRLSKYEDEGFSGRLVRGQIAGWASFIHQCPHDHTLIAENDCYLYVLKRQDMDELIKDHPAILAGFLMAATPMPATSKEIKSLKANRQVGVFIFDDLREEAGTVFDRLMSCYNNQSKITRYDYNQFSGLAKITTPETELFGPLAADVFAHLESENNTVFYTATTLDPKEWMQKITTQVDTLILVVKDTTQALPDWFAALVKTWQKKPGLVILRTEAGPFDKRVLGLWDTFEPEWHYRLHIDDNQKWGSVGRMALGKAVNLVLSGGGCLGAIHCGILKALTDADFPIDTIGGTSAGAGIAIGHSLGHSPEVTAEKFHYAFTAQKPFKSYTLPYYGLINPKRLDRVLKEITEGYMLEESHIPIHVTVTNLTKSCAEVLTTGSAWEAMRMTGSLPAILPPYIRNGCTYIDGGIINNFPISIAREKYSGRYVGVTFNIPKDNLVNASYEEMPNILQATLAKLKITKSSDFPGLAKVLAGSMMLSSTSDLKDAVNRVDLLLHPPVPSSIGITSFERFDELYEIGVEYGEQYVSELKNSNNFNELISF